MTGQATKPLFSLFFLALAAFLAGTLNGLLGTGGGMILLFAFAFLLRDGQAKEGFALSSIAVLSFCLVSVVFYGKGGSIDYALLPRFALPALAGGVLGAWLLRHIGTGLLRKLFALLLLWSGLKMTGVL